MPLSKIYFPPPGARKLCALVISLWDGIVADGGKYGIKFGGPGFSRDAGKMLSGSGYIYTIRNFDVFGLADIVEIRDARLDVLSGRACVRFVVVADAHDGSFESSETLQWLSEERRPRPLSSSFELRRQEIASLAVELDAYAHDVEAVVLMKLNASVEQLKARSAPKVRVRDLADT